MRSPDCAADGAIKVERLCLVDCSRCSSCMVRKRRLRSIVANFSILLGRFYVLKRNEMYMYTNSLRYALLLWFCLLASRSNETVVVYANSISGNFLYTGNEIF